MFTGIITDLGRVRELKPGAVTRLVIETQYDTGSIDLGASVACSGCCLSVVEKGTGWLAFEASNETLSVTTLGSARVSTSLRERNCYNAIKKFSLVRIPALVESYQPADASFGIVRNLALIWICGVGELLFLATTAAGRA